MNLVLTWPLFHFSQEILFLAVLVGPQQGTDDAVPPPPPEAEALVISAFSKSHDGWSVDELLLDDDRRELFIKECMKQVETAKDSMNEDALCRALLHVRKRGGRLPKTTRRAVKNGDDDALIHIAEIAARRIQDEFHYDTDSLLVNSKARERFDEIAEELLPGSSKYHMRKSAIRLRKTRKLEPELLSRVTDWKLLIRDYSSVDLIIDPSVIPTRPGIYLFRDRSGYIYIGQASNLRERLTKHLEDSDRKALAEYLTQRTESDVTIELHIFTKGSPGESTRIRRAYESELIRTRKPRFNVAP